MIFRTYHGLTSPDRRKRESFVAQAAKKGAQLVVFPEDAVTGPLTGQTAFIDNAPVYLRHFQKLAIKFNIDIVPGSWTVLDEGLLYNTSYYINKDGCVAGSYSKINLWETEKLSHAPGRAVLYYRPHMV
ncbi:MAG: carbon-nitrogen hydrolase family protein [Flavobacteriales bacterium]|jgi:predicted amidohydrolase|nr:carbon-nitrogen hydrolase family protein [Flavobacteriales bacterium]